MTININLNTITRSILAICLAIFILSSNLDFAFKAKNAFLNVWAKESVRIEFAQPSWHKTAEEFLLWNAFLAEESFMRFLVRENEGHHKLNYQLHRSFLNKWEKEQGKLIGAPRTPVNNFKRRILWRALDVEHAIFNKIEG